MPLGSYITKTAVAPAIRQWIGDTVCTVTERDDVDPAVDMFDQGVTSLAFIRIVAQINGNYGITVDVEELEDATIDSLSALVQALVDGPKPEGPIRQPLYAKN
jgi:acyl carrier protein